MGEHILHSIDTGIIITYLVTIVILGLLLSRRASKSLDAYFLGGKTMPWYFLGISNASSMFDITGTMWVVSLLFIYGVKCAWLPWLWPIFNTVFMAVYLSTWLRRSNALTGSEWMRTRFGDKFGGELAQISVAIFALVWAVSFLAYAFQGIGKFAEVFFPWDLSPNTYAVILMSITALYVIFGGMYSVIFTDIIQFVIMTICSFIVAGIAIHQVSPEALNAVIPDGWKELFFGWYLNMDWSELIPQVNNIISEHGYSPWGFFFMVMVFKGVLNSLAGPSPNFDMQRILAARNSKEASMLSGFTSLVLFFPRYLLMTGIGILALVFYSNELRAMGSNVDFEQILPYVINNYIPTGLVGLLLAGFLAAFMSTFDSTVNAGAAYAVNDIYKRYVNPNASQKKYVFMGYLCSIMIVLLGLSIGFMIPSIEKIVQWIVAGLYGGYTAPNILKWYWWRLNGIGYFVGMIVGICISLVLPVVAPEMLPLYGFPVILVLSLAGSIIVSLLTKPEDEEVIIDFYKRVRPWGFWRPIYEKVVSVDPSFERNPHFRRHMTNVTVGTIWQLTLIIIPIFLMIREYRPMWTTIAVWIIASVFLKKNWYDKLETD